MPGYLTAAELAVRMAVEDAVVRMFVATDERDWPQLEDCFTNPFTLDMTSMLGGSPAEMTPTQIARAWASGFEPLEHVHHQIGNLRTAVDQDRAVVKCHGIALHHRSKASGLKSRLFVGGYEIDLRASADRWRIQRLVFKLKFIDGNLELEKAG
jgi:hypothetical protein